MTPGFAIFGPLYFAAPWALATLLILPLLYWVLRAAPPPPKRALFPPARLLEGLSSEEQSKQRAPLWLLLLRMLALALAIIGFARPSLAPQAQASLGGPTLIVIDDGWTSAPFWPDARAAALDAIAAAERGRAPISILLTAPDIPAQAADAVLTPAAARAVIDRLEPKPWRPDRAGAAQRLAQIRTHFARVVWIADGLQDAGAQTLIAALRDKGPVFVRAPLTTAHAVTNAEAGLHGVDADVRRVSSASPETLAIAAETVEGRALGGGEARFAPGATQARAHIDLPPEIAQRAARVRIAGEASAGAARLLAGGAGRPFVGLVDPGGETQALVSDVYYLDRALSPYAGLERGAVDALLRSGAQAIIAPDSARLTSAEQTALSRWIDQGGLLIRFAGPRLANQADDLLPVRLRPGARDLGGALAWEPAQGFASFPETSPFAGLAPPADVLVRRHVMADPISLEHAQVWAALSDGAPIVTAGQRGKGLVVLFHVSAGPGWSDLPLSALYIDMLRRTLAFAGQARRAQEIQASGPYAPERLLNGFGALSQDIADARPIPAERFTQALAGPATPPGLYARGGAAGVIQAARADETLAPLQLPSGMARARLGQRAERPLAWAFLGGAALLLALDMLIALHLAGRLPRMAKRATAAAVVALCALLAAPNARAQETDPTLTLRLAYVRTGDSNLDANSRAGLEALSQMLRERTSVEPGPPIAIDLARDDLSALPFLYWPAPAAPRPLSDAALANLEHYLAIGGLLLIDTRDMGRAAPRGQEPAALMLSGLGTPPLEPVTTDHVAARAFYLMRGFPGRAPNAHLWAESSAAAASRDGVAALFIGDGDWASAWSGRVDLPGGARQRELALRFGVNLVMVALTGNYKADQVHVPALLERLGREHP